VVDDILRALVNRPKGGKGGGCSGSAGRANSRLQAGYLAS
jgi:hypothetical protein